MMVQDQPILSRPAGNGTVPEILTTRAEFPGPQQIHVDDIPVKNSQDYLQHYYHTVNVKIIKPLFQMHKSS